MKTLVNAVKRQLKMLRTYVLVAFLAVAFIAGLALTARAHPFDKYLLSKFVNETNPALAGLENSASR